MAKAKGIHDARYRRLIERLADIRRALGLTQQEVADILDRPQQFVSLYETGERRLDVMELVDVAAALDADVGALIANSLGDRSV